MSYRVTIYAPDRHLTYDDRTPDEQGIGGGVTARIRIARALARHGHQVTVVCNCPTARRSSGVRYLPLSQASQIESDVVILSSSAGTPDLRPALSLDVKSRVRIVRVDGTPMPLGLQELAYDYVYTPSNFIRALALREWAIPPRKLVVFHNGVDKALSHDLWGGLSRRRPYRLVYCGHPDKGLRPALGVLDTLRREDSRFELHAFGGDALYGKPDQNADAAAGFFYHGTVGQRRLYRELKLSSFAIQVQARPEPFGLVLVEAMAAGCVVVASGVGAIPEIIRHGATGFLLQGDHLHPDTWAKAAALILELAANPTLAEFVRRNARVAPITWEAVARSMTGHWDWVLAGTSDSGWLEDCGECGGRRIALADGYHCTNCGVYRREL